MFRLFICDEFAFKFPLGRGQLDARFFAPIPFRHRDILLIQRLKESSSFVLQGPVAFAIAVHES